MTPGAHIGVCLLAFAVGALPSIGWFLHNEPPQGRPMPKKPIKYTIWFWVWATPAFLKLASALILG